MRQPVRPTLLNAFAAKIGLSAHDLRILATEDLIKLTVPRATIEVDTKATWVELVADDVAKSLANDSVRVTRIRTDGRELEVSPPEEIPVAQLYVSESEIKKFSREKRIREDASLLVLDEDHPNHSEALAAAVRAWLSVCDSETIDTSTTVKQQLVDWLEHHYSFNPTTRNAVASVANPTRLKSGGRPNVLE